MGGLRDGRARRDRTAEVDDVGYETPVIEAWNWSFAPLDLIFSGLGFVGIALWRRGDARWNSVVLVSLALTFCAGLMAVAFWAIRGEYDPSWWAPNLALMAVAVWGMVKLVVRNA